MNTKIILFFVLSVYSISCSEQNKQDSDTIDNLVVITDFPSKQSLKGKVILENNYEKNSSIFVADTLLIIGMYHDSLTYNVYHTNSLKHLGALGKQGEGPNDWHISYLTGQYDITSKGIMVWVSEPIKGILSKVNVSKVIQSKSPKPVVEHSIKIDNNIFPFNEVFFVNDEKIIANSGYDDIDRVRIKSYNTKSKKIRKSDLFPKIKNAKYFPAPVLYNYYHTFFEKHPSENLFVQAMYVMNRIDIFDENLNLVKSIVGGENWKDDYFDAQKIDIETDFMKDIKQGYSDLAVTNHFIFALDINKKLSASTGLVQQSFIKVFDWEGNPKCLLEVPNDLFSITVDHRKGYLYAIDIENEKILRYDIKKLLKAWAK